MQTQEVDRIETWRLKQFVRLGFDSEQTETLLKAGIDYHDAESLVRRGCSPELVLRILT